jgi:hypothetical protein
MPRNNEFGIADQRILHSPEGAETTEFRDALLCARSTAAPACMSVRRGRKRAGMTGDWIKAVVLGSLVLLAANLGGAPAHGMSDEPATRGETVIQYLTPAILEMVFPGVGEVGGIPPSAAVYKGGQEVGYLFSTWDVSNRKGSVRTA